MNLNWKQIMQTINGDDRFYMNTEEDEVTEKEAGWEFLRLYGKDDDDDEEDEEDDSEFSGAEEEEEEQLVCGGVALFSRSVCSKLVISRPICVLVIVGGRRRGI
jgi:hypothetical protein